MKRESDPKSLLQAVKYFSDPDRALASLVARRWPGGVVCPTCGRKDAKFLANQRKWQCKSVHPKRQFSAKVGTIMEDSALPLEKWLPAIWLLANAKNGISSYELARAVGVTQKSAWFMLHRIRFAMRGQASGPAFGGSQGGEIEADETFIGPNPAKMHKGRRAKLEAQYSGYRAADPAKPRYVAKTTVQGLLDRERKTVRAKVVPNSRRESLQTEILANVIPGSRLYTDEHPAYWSFDGQYVHQIINHLRGYVDGRVHTNGMENFWSLLRRTLRGTYVAVEPFHLDSYLDEQVFRFNNRATKDNPLNDADRFALVASQVAGRRLQYKELIGKEGETAF